MDDQLRDLVSPAVAPVLMCPSLRHLPWFGSAFGRIKASFDAYMEYLDLQIATVEADVEEGKYSDSDESLPFVANYLLQKKAAFENEPHCELEMFRQGVFLTCTSL